MLALNQHVSMLTLDRLSADVQHDLYRANLVWQPALLL